MKKVIVFMLILCLLLSGCGAAGAGGATTEPSVSIPIWVPWEGNPDPLWWEYHGYQVPLVATMKNSWMIGNNWIGVPIEYKVDEALFGDAVISFEVSTNHGELFGDPELEKYNTQNKPYGATTFDAQLENGDKIENRERLSWRTVDDDEYLKIEKAEGVYIDAIIRAD